MEQAHLEGSSEPILAAGTSLRQGWDASFFDATSVGAELALPELQAQQEQASQRALARLPGLEPRWEQQALQERRSEPVA
jgi:hypothetical protein